MSKEEIVEGMISRAEGLRDLALRDHRNNPQVLGRIHRAFVGIENKILNHLGEHPGFRARVHHSIRLLAIEGARTEPATR